jgi:nitrite reductase (NADH) small subunit
VTGLAVGPAAVADTELGAGTAGWVEICRSEDVPPERGVAALVGTTQIALFRTFAGSLHAVGNRDPFSGVNVLARGIVGTRGDMPTVASPLYRQVFDLVTGVCLDDSSTRIPVYRVREHAGHVLVSLVAL